MNYTFDIVYDNDMSELLEDEGIAIPTLEVVLKRFIQQEFTSVDDKISNFIIPFVDPISNKRYTLYGNYQFKCSHIKFEIELLGVSIKTVKIKPCYY